MSYLTVISLANAKVHLGVDDTARDAEITRMISGALSFVEEHSNHILFARNKKYYNRWTETRVYDYPINSVVFPDPDTTTAKENRFYTAYKDSNADNTYLTLNVGYADPADIPAPLIEAGYMILEHLFMQKETGKSEMPAAAWAMIRSYARHTI